MSGHLRLGTLYVVNSAANYRAILPMNVMAERGHDVYIPPPEGPIDHQRLAECDVVHIYRGNTDFVRKLASTLIRAGVAITYDNDDDFRTMAKESPDYKKVGGLAGQRIHAATVQMARLAHTFTTTNEALAERYRSSGGIERIEVIPNHLVPGKRVRRQHQGLVIGWVAGHDHRADVARIPIREALQRILAKHPDVRVECIGVDLRLGSERYRHDPFVPFADIPGRMAEWDIGIAPLADIPANLTRSDVKVREYAASGLPWLASPVGPYAGLGDEQGGRLVPDGGWYEALDWIVTTPSERSGLAGNSLLWSRGLYIDAVADRWVQVFTEAANSR